MESISENGGYDHEKVDLLVAKFIHRQSRGQDPQLHLHCIVVNTALRRSDGQCSTADLGTLLATKKLAGAAFRSALARELHGLSNEVESLRRDFNRAVDGRS